jgi:hypothetical protein
VGEGEIADSSKLKTFGGYGIARIPALQELLRVICKLGFEHHVAMTHAQVGQAVNEALTTYMGWDVYHHEG